MTKKSKENDWIEENRITYFIKQCFTTSCFIRCYCAWMEWGYRASCGISAWCLWIRKKVHEIDIYNFVINFRQLSRSSDHYIYSRITGSSEYTSGVRRSNSIQNLGFLNDSKLYMLYAKIELESQIVLFIECSCRPHLANSFKTWIWSLYKNRKYEKDCKEFVTLYSKGKSI